MLHKIHLAFFTLFLAISTGYTQKLKWRLSTGGAIHASAVVGHKLVYLASADNYVYAADKQTGALVWKFKTDGPIFSTPCLYKDQLIFSSGDGFIYTVDQNTGTQIWKFKTHGEHQYDIWDYYHSSPIVYEDMVFIGCGDSTLYALDQATGKLNWSYKTNGIIHATPVAHQGNVYIGSFDGSFYALNSRSGSLLWKFKTDGDKNFPIGEIQKGALLYNNTLYFGSRDYAIYAVDSKTGTAKWTMKEAGSWIIATPFVYDGNIYFGTSDTHQFYCMDMQTGKVQWKLPVNMRVYGTAAEANGKIIFGCFNGKLYGVSPDGSEAEQLFQTEESQLRYSTIYKEDDTFRDDFVLYGDNYKESELKILSLGSILSTPVVDHDLVFIGDSNGYFYALQLNP